MTDHRDDPRAHRQHAHDDRHDHEHEHEHGGRAGRRRDRHRRHEPELPDSRSPSSSIAALLGPFIAPLAGALAAWLSTEFPGLELNANDTTEAIVQGATFLFGTAGAGALHYKILDGKQQWEKGVLDYHTQKLHGHRHHHHHHQHRPEYGDDPSLAWDAPPIPDAGWSEPDWTDASAWAGDDGSDDDYAWPDDTTADDDGTWVAYADVDDS